MHPFLPTCASPFKIPQVSGHYSFFFVKVPKTYVLDHETFCPLSSILVAFSQEMSFIDFGLFLLRKKKRKKKKKECSDR